MKCSTGVNILPWKCAQRSKCSVRTTHKFTIHVHEYNVWDARLDFKGINKRREGRRGFHLIMTPMQDFLCTIWIFIWDSAGENKRSVIHKYRKTNHINGITILPEKCGQTQQQFFIKVQIKGHLMFTFLLSGGKVMCSYILFFREGVCGV